MQSSEEDISSNPFFINALVLDLLSADIIDRSEAETLFVDPRAEAEEVERTGLTKVIRARIHPWKVAFEDSEKEGVKRWPHVVFPPLPPLQQESEQQH